MIRYMTVEHHKDTHLELKNNTIVGRVPVHDIMSNYYWTRLDDNHILLVGSHPLGSHKALQEHPKAVLLPYLHHRKTIHDHYKEKDRMAHHEALVKNLTLHPDDTMQELVDAAIEKHGAIFAPRM